MSYSYAKLRGRIVEKYSTQGNFANALSISEVALSKKMTCKTGLSQDDIEKWAEMLDIEKGQYGEYFFA